MDNAYVAHVLDIYYHVILCLLIVNLAYQIRRLHKTLFQLLAAARDVIAVYRAVNEVSRRRVDP